jgi:hypothetical protein
MKWMTRMGMLTDLGTKKLLKLGNPKTMSSSSPEKETSGFVGLFLGPVILSLGYKLFLAWVDDQPAPLETAAETADGGSAGEQKS